mgnify:CR=1 FL=1
MLSLPLGPSRAGLQAGEQLDRGEVGQPAARALVRAEGHLKREEHALATSLRGILQLRDQERTSFETRLAQKSWVSSSLDLPWHPWGD